MQDEYGYNPRKCISASTLSGCIECKMSKVISLTNLKWSCRYFWKDFTGGFSCVNTRLAFDTEIWLPNLTEKSDCDDVLQKDYSYKICYRLKLDSDKEHKILGLWAKF